MKKVLLWLFLFYFVLHLTNLTLLPSFNDESIYIDWAWSFTHFPGHLYDSLLDAKQPLMIWIFAFFQNFFSDPLLAGRFVSVLFGSLTMLGIYLVTKKLVNKQTAILAAFLYSIIPIFVFYNRQALMEASVACVGIWAFYALLNLITNPTIRNGAVLGAILGIGFFIKSSSLLFIVAAACVVFYLILRKGIYELTKPFFIATFSFFCVTFLLFINPFFWQTFSTNSRYSYTIAEIFTFPFTIWLQHLLGFFEIGFFFITPLVFIFGIIGIYLIKKHKIQNSGIFLSYFIAALLLEIFSAKFQGQRYLVPFLPFLIISAAYIMRKLWERNIWQKTIVVFSLLLPFVSSLAIIFNPDYYIMQLSKVSRYSEVGYVRGQTSGYGINEVMHYIKEHSILAQPTMVFFALNAGNPESAVNIYSSINPQLYAFHLDAKLFPTIDEYQCLSSIYPVFFVTRYDQQVGMDRFFELAKSFPNPDGEYAIGIYTLKKDCVGNTGSLSDVYKEPMIQLQQIKLGNATFISQ